MTVSNVSSTNQPASVNTISSTAPAPQADKGRSNADTQEATVVTISVQARKLSVSQEAPAQSQTRTNQTQASNRVEAAVAEKVVLKAKEAAESPQAQLKQSEVQPERNQTKGRINTYA